MREDERGARLSRDRSHFDQIGSPEIGRFADANAAAGDGLSRREFLQQAAAGTAAVGMMGGQAAPFGAAAAPAKSDSIPVTLTINGQSHELRLDPRVTLLDALREHLGLTGT